MKNEKKELLKKAAAGDAETMYLLAQDYENEGNFDNAFFWYNKTAIQGLADGINSVAMYYLESLVVTPDVDKAINLLESIADKIPVAKIIWRVYIWKKKVVLRIVKKEWSYYGTLSLVRGRLLSQ